VGESRSTSTLPASPEAWFWGASPICGAGPWSVIGAAQFDDDEPEPEPEPDPDPDPDPDGGAVVAVEPPVPVVELPPEPEPEPEFDMVEDVLPLDDDVVVVALAGPGFLAP